MIVICRTKRVEKKDKQTERKIQNNMIIPYEKDALFHKLRNTP